MNKINQVAEYVSIENATMGVVDGVTNVLKSKDNWLEIPNLSKKVTKKVTNAENVFKITDGSGKDVLTVSIGFVSASLETPTLKVHVAYNNRVTLSEPVSGMETIYTDEGKLVTPSKQLMLFAKDEGDIVVNKILKNIFEETLPRMSLKDKRSIARFEEAVRSFMCERKEMKARRTQNVSFYLHT